MDNRSGSRETGRAFGRRLYMVRRSIHKAPRGRNSPHQGSKSPRPRCKSPLGLKPFPGTSLSLPDGSTQVHQFSRFTQDFGGRGDSAGLSSWGKVDSPEFPSMWERGWLRARRRKCRFSRWNDKIILYGSSISVYKLSLLLSTDHRCICVLFKMFRVTHPPSV